MDVLTPEQRRHNMQRIGPRDTRIEILVRRGLHAAGLRYRLHVPELPGSPDIVLSRYHAVVLVHGCFWHGHECPLFKLPATRGEFWQKKIAGNRQRDDRVATALRDAGWRLLTVWECSLKGPFRKSPDEVIATCIDFIRGTTPTAELTGTGPR